MPALTDIVVALFVAVLVLGGLYVPRIGDAVGRRLRGGEPRTPADAPRRDPPAR
jgi:hypothetical protein